MQVTSKFLQGLNQKSLLSLLKSNIRVFNSIVFYTHIFNLISLLSIFEKTFVAINSMSLSKKGLNFKTDKTLKSSEGAEFNCSVIYFLSGNGFIKIII